MIHQVKPSPSDVEKLKQVVTLQLSLLEFATAQTAITTDNVEAHLDATYGPHARDLAKWITDKQDSLVGKLCDFAAHPDSTERAAFVAHMREDVKLLYAPIPKRLLISLDRKAPVWKQAAGDFCRHFYELWGKSGFPWYAFNSPLPKDTVYRRWDFIDGFTVANEGLYLCCICDATAYRTTVDSKAYTSIEHFFPKSRYPHLVLHPFNLIPICTACNGIAGDADLMSFCGDVMGIQELLLPYQKEQAGLSQVAYIEICPRTSDGAKEGQHPLEIRLKPAKGQSSGPLIESFKKTYKVDERWNAEPEIDRIGEHVFRRMQQFFFGDVQLGADLSDVTFVAERIELLMALTSRENLGKDPFGFVTVWMLKHFVDSLRRDGCDSPVYQSLHGWAKGHKEMWEALKCHVAELYGRVQDDPSKELTL